MPPGRENSLLKAPRRMSPEKRVYGMDLGKEFVPHGAQDKLYAYCGLDEASIIKKAEEVLEI